MPGVLLAPGISFSFTLHLLLSQCPAHLVPVLLDLFLSVHLILCLPDQLIVPAAVRQFLLSVVGRVDPC